MNDGGIYDWEISDFDGSAGSGWDVLAYNALTFEGGQAFDINIFSLQSNGTAGANSGNTFALNLGLVDSSFLMDQAMRISIGEVLRIWNGGGTLSDLFRYKSTGMELLQSSYGIGCLL